MFDTGGNPFILNYGDTTFTILPMDMWCSIEKSKWLRVESYRFSLIGENLEASVFTISGIRFNWILNLEFPPDRNTKKFVDDYTHRPLYVDNLGMIGILVKFKKILSCVVLHLVPTTHYPDNIRPIIIIICIYDIFLRRYGKKLYTPLDKSKSRQIRGSNFSSQMTDRVKNVNPGHDRNMLNLSKIMRKMSMVLMFRYLLRASPIRVTEGTI